MIDGFNNEQSILRIPQNSPNNQMGKRILDDAIQYLEQISEKEHRYLIQSLSTLSVEESYFEVLSDELDQPIDAKIANDALNLIHFWKFFQHDEDLATFKLLDIVQHTIFEKDLFMAFDAMDIGALKSQRRKVIAEALKLYKLECYAGCIAILYAQIEGLLTDILVQYGYLQPNQSKFIDVYKIVPGLKAHEVKSLWHKVKIACELNPYFLELAAFKMDNSSIITMTRHNILHGTDLTHFNQGRSFILFLWLFSVISFMSTLKR